ncbi:MAG: glycosyl hydrolase family 28-related protein, partial [Pseudomonadota bacterium]|nr:glycosyl hydrolase family 28-related protein [Pseudomonadota bacterium]
MTDTSSNSNLKHTSNRASVGRAAGLASLAILVTSACTNLHQAHSDEPLRNGPGAAELPDYSYAGYQFGIGQIPDASGEIIDATDFGVIADDGLDDSAALLDTLRAAHAVTGPVTVQLPAGRLVISEILPIERSHIVLRGAGAGVGGTELHFPRPLAAIDQTPRLDELRTYLRKYDKRQREPERNIDALFSEYSWTGGFIWIQKPGTRAASYLEEFDPPIERLTTIIGGSRGEKQLQVDSTDKLRVGDAVQIHWFNRDGEDGALLSEIYGETDLAIGSHHWTFADRPLVRQTTRILAIDGATVEIGDPLLHSISVAVPAQISQWDHLEQVGLED